MTARASRRTTTFLLAGLLALGACTGEGGDPPENATDSGAPLLVASGRDVTGKGGIREKLIKEWNARPGNTHQARLVELPGSADQQRSQLLGALQSGSARYDVVNLDVTWVPEFAEAKLVQELDAALVGDDVIDSVARTARWKDKTYSVPFNTDVGLLYYRRDHLERAGVQEKNTRLDENTTWDDVRDLIRTVDRADLPGVEAGWTSQLAPYEGLTVNGIEAFASVLEDGLTDENGRYTATVGGLEDGLEELRDRTESSYLLPAATGSDEAASLTDFIDGRTTFLRHWPYAYRTLHQSLTPEKLGVAPLPGKAVLGGQNLAVTTSATGARADAARDLITFLTDPQSERCLLDAGFAATRESAYTEDAVSCRLPAASGPSPSAESADRMPREEGRPLYARTTLLTALKGEAVTRPRTPHYGAFTQTFTTHLSKLFGDSPPDPKHLAGELDKALRHALPEPSS
ncbi:extracellular solute-binding protein [Streptomyces sp. NPDC056222]|uniref:extracellular solute-binding protein n=1 Tax=Streptomyces sp. NPDC056222 TaxID=3345749 RepID=UPI0035E2B8DF